MILEIYNENYLVAPVYVCPQNPRNTMSLGALKSYSGFSTASLDVHTAVELVDPNGRRMKLNTNVHNGLDFVTFKIVSFSPHFLGGIP